MKIEHFNSPVRNCTTCAHYVDCELGVAFGKCGRFGGSYCNICVVHESLCGRDIKEWRQAPPPPPKPEPRSLRQWFYDTFWKLNDLP